MDILKQILYFNILAYLIILMPKLTFAVENSNEDSVNVSIIGIVPFDKSGINSHILKQIDQLVPALKKMPANKIIRLDCSYKGDATKEADVRAAYNTAAKIEKYLRERHKLKLDLWVSTQLNHNKKVNHKLVFSVLSNEMAKYQKLPVHQNNE